MRIIIKDIKLAFDTKTNTEIIYGVDINGIVFWYRQWSDDKRTEGWVPLVMETSEILELKKQDENEENKSA